ncbi:MAG: hypothetical protein QOF84_7671 [Streptomyces sp.]|jgi:hypothetical protein|nr:hypothetical protein [Streptomyces sp.]
MLDRVVEQAVRPVAALLALAIGLAVLLLPVGSAYADTTSTFTPGAARSDTSGNALQMHGLGIIKVGSTWYGYGENKSGESSSDTSFQSINCYSSTDLSSWTYIGKSLSLQSSGDLGPNRIVERPKVIHNATTGKYVMYLHIDNKAYSEAKVGVATSDTPCGAYTYLSSAQPLGFQSRDLGLFQDTDGTGYLLSEDRANGLRIDKLSADYLTVDSAVAVFADYEAPAMAKINGTYYLLGSKLTGWSLNDNVYATATSLSGTWSAFRTFAPVGTNTYSTQTANIIPVQGTSGTTYLYAGDRWTTADLGASPMVWLPLTVSGTTVTVGWQNSWSLDVTTGAWSAGSSNPANGTVHLTNANSGLVADVSGGSTANGGQVIQYTNNGGTNQQWTLARVSGNVYTLTNVKSGKCLEVPGQSTTQGTQLTQYTCNGGTNQQWALDATGTYTSSTNTRYTLVNANSGWVADVAGNSTSAGAVVDQWVGNGGANQTWSVA